MKVVDVSRKASYKAAPWPISGDLVYALGKPGAEHRILHLMEVIGAVVGIPLAFVVVLVVLWLIVDSLGGVIACLFLIGGPVAILTGIIMGVGDIIAGGVFGFLAGLLFVALGGVD